MDELPNTVTSLKDVQPLAADLSEYITNLQAAQQLGKALFWDTQVGSNGAACASCHFHAGADIRIKNQVNPGLKAGDSTFSTKTSGQGHTGPNALLGATDFPFRRLSASNDRESSAVFESNDVFSSQGSIGGDFVSEPRPRSLMIHRQPVGSGTDTQSTDTGSASGIENCNLVYDPSSNPFHANGLMYRKVEPRQTPTVINAVFNVRQFWDGRANRYFNGIDPFGARTYQPKLTTDGPGNPDAKSAGIIASEKSSKSGPRLVLRQPLIANSSLASQAVGPPLSDFEMSCANKTFADLGRKLLPLRALANQSVHANDSLLSRESGLVLLAPRKGLNTTYRRMIEKAFAPKYWADTTKVKVTSDGQVISDLDGYTQIEHNFSLFWGLAIQAYETLLVSDDSPFDRAMNGNPLAMSDMARAGLGVFSGRANCIGCHYGPLLSGATAAKSDTVPHKAIERMIVGSGQSAFYDNAFYNIGVRPTSEDAGVGGMDPYGFDLSFSRQFKWRLAGAPQRSADTFDPQPCRWTVQFWPCDRLPTTTNPSQTERDAVDGSFKVPILRNVGLNPPYFHNGGQATLKDVVRFYNRGGDRRGPIGNDTSGSAAPNPFGQIAKSNLAPDIGDVSPETFIPNNGLGLTDSEMDALVAFMLSLTDERVACHGGIFDHPELPIVMGQKDAAVPNTQVAQDIIQMLPATGPRGLRAAGKPCFPNSGDLFGSVNALDPSPLQSTFDKILDPTFVSFTEVASGTDPVNGKSGANGGPNGGDTGNFIEIIDPASAIVTPTVPPPVPPPVFSVPSGDIHGFTAVGFIQNATVSNKECRKLPARQWGGTAVVNDQTIVIPCNTIVQMPAATYTWAELFPPANGGVGSEPKSLTLTPSGDGFYFPSTQMSIVGNIVGDRYIAGLITISQEYLNTGSGFITGFDYEQGVIYVSDKPSGEASVRLQINDPLGRFSKGQSPDQRFSVDDANPTIRASSGYPMCVPRTDPSQTDDPLCPQRNRPKASDRCRRFVDVLPPLPSLAELAPPRPGQVYCSGFVMGDPATAGPTEPTSRQQAPFEIGDFITYSGTLLAGDTSGPGGSATISVHTIVANVGIYTYPRTLPAYIAMEEFRIAAFAPRTSINGVPQEPQDRLVLEAVVTDLTSIVDVYLIDADPETGKKTYRWVTPATMTGGVGAIGSNGHLIDGGITTQFVGPVPGRVRIAANKAVPGLLDSPTRYIGVAMRQLCDPANINSTAPKINTATPELVPCLERATAANGLLTGQYFAPVFDFIFPENLVPGDPLVPNNFWNLGFLVNGEGPGTGRLQPTPW